MNDQERQVIADIFRRLEQVANQQRDPEAEAFIADKVRQQPYAPYAMAQAIFVQEQALAKLHAENEALRTEMEEARRHPPQGGFLSGLFGGGAQPSQPSEPAYQPPPRQASPWGQPQPMPQAYPQQAYPQQAYPQQPFGAPQGGMPGGAPGPWGGGLSRGGGFLQGALSTAAGVAGGMMMANALSHVFGGAGGALQGALGDRAGLGSFGDAQGNDAQGNDARGGDTGMAGITDSLYPDQTPDDGSQDAPDDFNADGDSDDNGDGGDWI